LIKINNIIVIPARKKSKRFPGKNMKLFSGIPLIAHSILYAKQSNLGRIVVSSDDKQVEQICKDYNVEFQNRPAELASDFSPTVDTLKHVLQSVDNDFDNVILLQPTNPLRPKNLLREAYAAFNQNKSDSLMSVSRNHQKLGKIVNNQFVPFNYIMGQRSQDLEPLYYENGLLYITKASLILKDIVLGPNNLPYLVDHPYASVDIDTIDDLKYAEFILNQYPNA
jgi:CMP-N-acetylneuraminic acid synthetase